MTVARIKLGGMVYDPKANGGVEAKRLIYTDAVAPGGITPDNELIQNVAKQAQSQANSAGENDGIVFAPWQDIPHA